MTSHSVSPQPPPARAEQGRGDPTNPRGQTRPRCPRRAASPPARGRPHPRRRLAPVARRGGPPLWQHRRAGRRRRRRVRARRQRPPLPVPARGSTEARCGGPGWGRRGRSAACAPHPRRRRGRPGARSGGHSPARSGNRTPPPPCSSSPCLPPIHPTQGAPVTAGPPRRTPLPRPWRRGKVAPRQLAATPLRAPPRLAAPAVWAVTYRQGRRRQPSLAALCCH